MVAAPPLGDEFLPKATRMTDEAKTTGSTAEPSRPQNVFEYILGMIFFVPVLISMAALTIAYIILFPFIWLVEGRRGKVPSPEIVPSPAMQQTLPTPASEADARSLEIQDQIEAESRQIGWEQIRAANATKRGRSKRTSRPRKALQHPSSQVLVWTTGGLHWPAHFPESNVMVRQEKLM